MKHVPNVISLFRLIAIGPLLFIAKLENNPLPFVKDNPLPFVPLFAGTGGHAADPRAIVRPDYIRLVGVMLGADFFSVPQMPEI